MAKYLRLTRRAGKSNGLQCGSGSRGCRRNFRSQFIENLSQERQNVRSNSRLQNELQSAIGSELRSALRRYKARQLLGTNACVLLELDGDELALALDGVYSDPYRQQFERGILQQIAHRRRRLSVAVLQFGTDIRQLRFGFHPGDPFIHPQTLVLFRNVFERDADVEAEVELGGYFLSRRLALHLTHRAVQHLSVEFEPDGFDVPALFATQQIAGATEFEIEGRDLEACAQVGEFFQGRQTAPGDGCKFNVCRDQQVGICTPIRSPHTAAQLVELRQSKTIGAVDDDGITQRNVEAVLDNRRGHKNVSFVMHEFKHHFFQFSFRHLAVSHDDAGLRDQRLKFGGNLPNTFYAVVDEINLAAT